jgi:hypothetical protein
MNRMEEEQFIQQTYRQPYPRKIAEDAGVYTYDDFVWKLARKFTNSNEEAAAAADEMFNDIRRCAEGSERPTETRLTAKIAFRRLLKFLR